METLFEWKELSRRNDPESSKEAARDMVTSGNLAKAEQLAYSLIMNHPGLTAREIEELKDLERCTIQRRVSKLVERGLVVKGDMKKQSNGRKAATLYTPSALAIRKPR